MTSRYRAPTAGLVEQTALLKDLDLPEVASSEGAQAFVKSRVYPWIVVLSQDCDLNLDRLARAGLPIAEGKPPVGKDKILLSILLCPAFALDHVLAGTYIEGARRVPSNEESTIQQNRHERFHVLGAETPLVPQPLALDFKLIVSAAPEFVQNAIRTNPETAVAVLCPPYRDRLIQRFTGYFGRIAEP